MFSIFCILRFLLYIKVIFSLPDYPVPRQCTTISIFLEVCRTNESRYTVSEWVLCRLLIFISSHGDKKKH